MLEISLLGSPLITLNQQPAQDIRSRKSLALLFYLAVTAKPASRQKLAGLLWSDLPESRARTNLRVALNKLRPVFDPYLIIRRRTLAFNPDGSFTLDTAVFENHLQRPSPDAAHMQTAVDLYRGDFLEDFNVQDAAVFDEWVLAQRERLRQMTLRALFQLTHHYIERRQIKAGIRTARRTLELEPWLEEGHRQLMLLLALDGQRSAALAQYDVCFETLMAELGVEPGDETTQLYAQISLGEIEAVVEKEQDEILLPATQQIPFQAPRPSPHFVGRYLLLDQIRQDLTNTAGAGLVALVGMGGVGKTTLAVQATHDLRAHFSDGVLWANLASSDPGDILESWAQAYGYNLSGLNDLESRAAAWRGLLADKQLLLILDDVRSLSRIRPLLPGGARCAVLLTTRDHDLAHSLNAQIMPIGMLDAANSRELLMRVLGEKRVLAEMEAAETICKLLDYLPLAVEITAQRLASRPRRLLRDMAQRLQAEQDKLSLLQISDRAVRASFMVSWDALDSRLQQIFATMGVFNGRSFTADALAYVTGLDAFTAEDQLFALAALSLVNEIEPNRYQQHALLAEFAHEKLKDAGDLYLNLSHYYVEFANEHRTDLETLQPEWENMIAGMEIASNQGNLALTNKYAISLSDAWFKRGRFSEARQGYQWVSTLAHENGNREILANVLMQWGRACLEQSDYSEAEQHLSETARLYETLGDRQSLTDVWYHQARIELENGHYERAHVLLSDSQKIKAQLGDDLGLAKVCYGQARIAYHRGNYILAATLLEESKKIQTQNGDLPNLIMTLRLLTDCALAEKDADTAELYCRQVLELCEQTQQQDELAAAQYALAALYRQKGNFALAEEYGHQSLSLFTRLGDRHSQGLLHYHFSLLNEDQGKLIEALSLGKKSLAIFIELNDAYHQALLHLHLSDLYKGLNKQPQVNSALQTALTLARSIPNQVLIEAAEKRILVTN